jgi:hypothetical protein
VADRDAVVMAFGDHVVGRLRGIAKALFSNGRFVSVGPGGAVVALENAHTVKQAGKYVAEVENLLAEALGQPMPITLVTEAEAGSAAPTTPPSPSSPGGEPEDGKRSPSPGGVPEVANRSPAPLSDPPAASDAALPPKAPATAEREPRSFEDELAAEMTEVGDVHSLPDADVANNAVEKIIEAFPGSEIIDPGDNG